MTFTPLSTEGFKLSLMHKSDVSVGVAPDLSYETKKMSVNTLYLNETHFSLKN